MGVTESSGGNGVTVDDGWLLCGGCRLWMVLVLGLRGIFDPVELGGAARHAGKSTEFIMESMVGLHKSKRLTQSTTESVVRCFCMFVAVHSQVLFYTPLFLFDFPHWLGLTVDCW